MSSEPADIAVLERSGALAPTLASRATPALRRLAVRDTWQALVLSRVLVWVAGVGYALLAGPGPLRHVYSVSGLTRGLGRVGDLLAAPAARWDAAWYLTIASHGYSPGLGLAGTSRAAFFPLYPLVVGIVGASGIGLVAAGVLVSLAALAVSLYVLHRLTALEFASAGFERQRVARYAVLALALFPTAFFLSAAYSESLYLALSLGVFWFARQDRWGYAAVLAAFAAATRSAGVVLLAPVVVIYLYGPRGDRRPDRIPAGGALARLLPRYRLRPDALWMALVPLGLIAYLGYLAASGEPALLPFHAQAVWHRDFAGPFGAVIGAAVAAFEGVRQLVTLNHHVAYFPAGGRDPVIAAEHNVVLFFFLLAMVPALVAVFRRLPLAYGVYVVAALAMPLSYPTSDQPLMSFPRFELVLFPLAMVAGAWLAQRPRRAAALLTVSALALCVCTAQFATWHWVA